MRRVNGAYEWDDGSDVTYTNWDPADPQNKKCVCMSVAKSYKWVSADCEQNYAYQCNRVESGKVWMAQYADANQWLQIDLGTIMKVSGVLTQGRVRQDLSLLFLFFYIGY